MWGYMVHQPVLALLAAKPETTQRELSYLLDMRQQSLSELLAKLEHNLKNDEVLTKLNKGKPLVISFNFENKQEDIQVLTSLRNLLSQKTFGWRFPKFEVALYLYGQRIGEDVSAPEVSGYLDKNGLKTVVDVATNLPIVGGVLKFISIVDQGQAALRSLLKQHSALVKEFEELTTEEQREKLPYYFAQDLSAHTCKSSTPLVIMLDTFECVGETTSTNDSRMGRDYWLWGEDGLIPNSKNTLFVIAGRHKITWKDIDFPIEQHLLGSLSPEDSFSYLTSFGLPQELWEHLYRLTDGLPLYLKVCVQHYGKLRKKNIPPEPGHFGDTPKELTECYVRYMDKSEKQLVHMLSFLPEWDRQLVQDACKSIFGHFSPADFKRMEEDSITTELSPGRYFIHRTVADILQNSKDNELREDTAQFMIEHFSQVLKTADPYSPQAADAVGMVLQGGLLLHQDRDSLVAFYREKLDPHINMLILCRRNDHVMRYIQQFWAKAQEEKGDFLYAMALRERAWRTYQVSGIKGQLMLDALESLKLHISLRGEKDFETLDSLMLLGIFLDAYNHHEDAIPVHEYVADQFEKHHPDKFEKALICKRNHALSYKALSYYAKAIVMLKKVLEEYRQKVGTEDRNTLAVMQELASTHAVLNEYKSACPLAEEALAISRRLLTENHPDTLNAILTLLLTYDKMGDHDKAVALYDELIQLRTRHLGNTHPDTFSAMESLANSYSAYEDHRNAMAVREKLVTLQEQVLEPADPVYQKSLTALADSCRKAYKHQRAIQISEQLLSVQLQSLGPHAKETISTMESLADAYKASLDYPGAQKLLQQLLQIRKETFGDYTNVTIKTQETLSSVESMLGNFAEAIRLQADALEQRLVLLQWDSTDFFTSILHLTDYCLHGNQPAVGIQFCDKLLAIAADKGQEDSCPAIYALSCKGDFLRKLDPATDLRKFYFDQVESWQSLWAHDPGKVTIAMADLGKFLNRTQEDLVLGKELMEQAIQLRRELDLPYSFMVPDLAKRYEALEMYEEALELQQLIRKKKLQDQMSTKETDATIHILLRKLGRLPATQAIPVAPGMQNPPAPPIPQPCPISHAPERPLEVTFMFSTDLDPDFPSYLGLSMTKMLKMLEKPYMEAFYRMKSNSLSDIIDEAIWRYGPDDPEDP